MSAVVIVSDDLRERVAQVLRGQARDYPHSSAAARIKPEFFDTVTEEVSKLIDLDHWDLDTTVTANVGRVLRSNPQWFQRLRVRPGADQFKNYLRYP